jgi:hypothetical protein
MPDARSPLRKAVDKLVGMPLYYCEECLLPVKVTEQAITKKCQCEANILAPRKAIVTGDGGLSVSDKIKVAYWQAGAAITGRCV